MLSTVFPQTSGGKLPLRIDLFGCSKKQKPKNQRGQKLTQTGHMLWIVQQGERQEIALVVYTCREARPNPPMPASNQNDHDGYR